MSNSNPDINAIANALNTAPPVIVSLDAATAFTLVAQLQLVLKHPANQGKSGESTKAVARAIADKLATISVHIKTWLDKGWDADMDVTEKEAQQVLDNKLRLSSFHNIIAVHDSLQLNGGIQAIKHKRPADWGNPNWFYNHISLQYLYAGTRYTAHLHIWQQIQLDDIKTLNLLSPSLFDFYLPGDPPEICGLSHLAPGDEWQPAWGDRPPYAKLDS